METTYFRFSRDVPENKVFNQAATSILLITLPLVLLMIAMREPLSELASVPGKTSFIVLSALIIGFDAVAVIPFAKLRYDQRPRKFALIKIANILLNVFFVWFFIMACPWLQTKGYELSWYDKDYGIGYAFVVNLMASAFALLLLYKEVLATRLQFDKELWSKMIRYSLPLLIVGLAGMINESLDKFILPKWLPYGLEKNIELSGIYALNFKLAALIILFIQAFRMGAEPFFIKQSKEKNAQLTYARIMTLFVIICCFGFLCVAMFYDIWKYYILAHKFPERAAGFVVVPILLLGKIMFGIYYNLTVWFKLKNKTHIGAMITVVGAIITLAIDYAFIPKYGYITCAWAALAAYTFMVVASYILGQKHYPIPYDIKRIFIYLCVTLGIFAVHYYTSLYLPEAWMRISLGAVFVGVFGIFTLFYDKKEFSTMPIIGKYLK